MPEKRPMQTKAISAYLTFRQTPLISMLARIGVDRECASGETLSDDITGRIARLLGLTPERLAELVAAHNSVA